MSVMIWCTGEPSNNKECIISFSQSEDSLNGKTSFEALTSFLNYTSLTHYCNKVLFSQQSGTHYNDLI